MANDKIDQMTVKELKAYLKAAGMKGYSTMKKAELLNAAHSFKAVQDEIVFFASVCDAYYAITPREIFEEGLMVSSKMAGRSREEIHQRVEEFLDKDILYTISCANKSYIYMGGQKKLTHAQAGQLLIRQGAVPYEKISKESYESLRTLGYDKTVEGYRDLEKRLREEEFGEVGSQVFLAELFYRVGTGEPGSAVITEMLNHFNLLNVKDLVEIAERCVDNTPQARYRGHSASYIREFYPELLEKDNTTGYIAKGDTQTLERAEKKIYPNEPCPCGSGKKYKKCCGRR